jgi:hypothetical protein
MVAGLEPFDQLLREKLHELEQDDAAREALLSDPVELLRLAALRALAGGNGHPLPRHGAGGYLTVETDRQPAPPPKLDVKF